MKNAGEWRQQRLAYIRGLKNPTRHQKLLLVLVGHTERTDAETRKLEVLWRAERAEERAQATRTNAARVVNADDEAARKARNHRLIEQGALQDIAGLESWDRGTLLGALLGLAQINDPERLARWKAMGDAELALREQNRKAMGVNASNRTV